MTFHSPVDEEVMLAGAWSVVDPVPTALTEYAKAVLRWRSLDAELAQITRDSADTDTPAGVRSARGFVQEFQALGVTLTLEFHPAERHLKGEVRPDQVVQIELFTSEGTIGITTQSDGRFEFVDVPSGPTSVLCTMADGRGGEISFKTEWRTL